MSTSAFGEVRYIDRWFCYFDLLGFSRLAEDQDVDEIIPTYEDVVRQVEEQTGAKSKLGVSSSWFSDTFIFFSRGGTDREFAAIEQAGRLFFQGLLAKRIPVRGALTYGKLYSRVDKNIFVGPALIDAYQYGECQNWVGFILTPSVHSRCRGTVLDLDQRPHYRRVESAKILRGKPHENVYAFTFSNVSVGGKNPYLGYIREMRGAAGPEHRKKYDNTEAFLLRHAQASRRTRASA
ncbi:MAG: hypothetical protein Q8L86_15985 [Vicinamibacterales bacterium]|nr:hypothetical protein [Vicinamibacterales bacterium]